MAAQCTHVADHVKKVKPHTQGLRGVPEGRHQVGAPAHVPECGHVGCCDSSQGQHARGHFHATQHPIIQSAERGEDWRWCYIDEAYL